MGAGRQMGRARKRSKTPVVMPVLRVTPLKVVTRTLLPAAC
jgi:hypothetical protein